MLAARISGTLLRHLRQVGALGRCEFQGKSWSTFKQICDVAQSQPLESPRGLKPSPSLPRSRFLLLPNSLTPETSKRFWRRKHYPLAFPPVDLSHHSLSANEEAYSPGASHTRQDGNLKLHPKLAPLEITMDVWEYLILSSEEGGMFFLHDFSASPGSISYYLPHEGHMSAPCGQGFVSVLSTSTVPASTPVLGTGQGFGTYVCCPQVPPL